MDSNYFSVTFPIVVQLLWQQKRVCVLSACELVCIVCVCMYW